MDRADSMGHSFIIQIWRAEGQPPGEKVAWRGSITHVLGGKQRVLTELSEIREFIATYLADLGVKPKAGFRRWKWFRCREDGTVCRRTSSCRSARRGSQRR